MKRSPISILAAVCAAAAALLAAACSSTASKAAPPKSAEVPAGYAASEKKPEAPAGYKYDQPLSKTDPNVVEETDTYYVRRYKKSEMIRVDEGHVRLPMVTFAVPIYKEDAEYYYIRSEKLSPQEIEAKNEARKKAAEEKLAADRAAVEKAAETNPLIVTPEQFQTVEPRRAAAGLKFERAGKGLPERGQWRQTFAVADMNGDGIPDIVAAPARLGSAVFHVFLGDGHGGFRAEEISIVDPSGKVIENPKLEYGGTAVADFDGDGKPDVALASHGQTIRVFLNRGGGKFQVWEKGLPPKYSSQAVAAFDVNGDGRPDLVVSRDIVSEGVRKKEGRDYHQVRVFLNEGKAGWKSVDDAIEGACFSYDVYPIALTTGTGPGILTGCRYLGGWGLTWKNDGRGKFSNELFKIIEQAAYHFAVAPGSVGSERHPAFADLFLKVIPGKAQAGGLNVYYQDGSAWHKIVLWRLKNFSGRLTSVAMGDLDGDGLDDVVFPDRNAKKVRIFFQKPDGSFEESPAEAEPALDSPAVHAAIVDLNGDGRPDIVLGKTAFSENPKDPGGLEVLLNRGNP